MGQNELFILLCIFAYLVGSLPFGKLAGLAYGVDIQKKGSGNIGFANVRRILGWPAGLFVLVGDMSKGFIPVYIAHHHFPDGKVMITTGVVLLGSLFPVWLKFKGGKGVATTLGFSLAVSFWAGLLAVVTYLAFVSILKLSAPSSLAAVWVLPVLMLIFGPAYFWLYLAVALVITWSHRTNISNLVNKRRATAR